MSLFGKKADAPPTVPPPLAQQPRPPTDEPRAHGRSYGVADLIQLMKSIPIDHQPDLVVQVVKSTLKSVGVHVPDIIEDAMRHEGQLKDRIAGVEGEIQALSEEIDRRKELIVQLQADMADLTYAKERWQDATSTASSPPPEPHAKSHVLPPPLPPPFPKNASGKPPELV
jgi:hypothetical protein